MAAEHITSASGVFTPEGYAAALEQFGNSIMPAVLRAAKSIEPVLRTAAIKGFIRQGVGRGLFGADNKWSRGLIHTKSVLNGKTVVLALELRGFAALQELGGKTRPHEIAPKRRQALALKVAGGSSTIFLRRGLAKSVRAGLGGVIRLKVHHPGSRIRRVPFATQAVQSMAKPLQQAMDFEITKFRTGGIAIASSSLVA